MINSESARHLLSIFLLGLAFTVLTACGYGGGNNADTSSTATGTGSVALLLTDAPSDIFDEINITVIKAELMSDHGRVTIFQGQRTFNLLDLTDARIFAIREGIPSGMYNKIRLTLADIELVDYNGTNNPADDAVYHPKLPGNGKLDLNPRGSFRVVAGGTLVIQIDMDANKSIHIVKKGKKDEYNFRPVVFIDIVTDAFKDRFVKLHGDIHAIDSTDQSFKLCNTDIPVQTAEDLKKTGSRGCVRVESGNNTAYFDINGMPATFSSLVEGEPATVFGRLQYDKYIDYHRDDDRELRDLVLQAVLVELGPEASFQKLNGTATSAVDVNDQFTMDVEPGQGLITPLSLNIQIQQGTLLINRKGQPVTTDDIVTGKLVSARGVLDVNNDTLFASVIVVDTDSSTQLTGTVGANPDSICGFTLMTATGDRSIHTDSNTKAFLVVNGTSSQIDVSALSTGQQADVYGIANINGCFDAHTIIAY
jgi:hypothetical protein